MKTSLSAHNVYVNLKVQGFMSSVYTEIQYLDLTIK